MELRGTLATTVICILLYLTPFLPGLIAGAYRPATQGKIISAVMPLIAYGLLCAVKDRQGLNMFAAVFLSGLISGSIFFFSKWWMLLHTNFTEAMAVSSIATICIWLLFPYAHVRGF